MPGSKLTLSADKEVIERAKKLAERQRRRVSAMFSRSLMATTRGRPSPDAQGPITRQATGLIRIPTNKRDQRLLEEALARFSGAGRPCHEPDANLTEF